MVSIKTIFLINVIFLCLVLIYYFRAELTGLQSLVSDSLGIDLSIGGLEVDVRIYTDQVKYCPNETSTIETLVENTGIGETTGNLTLVVLRPIAGAPKFSDSWQNVDLSMGETKGFISLVNFTDDDVIGRYTIEAEFHHAERVETDEVAFIFGKGIGLLTASPPQIEKTIQRDNFATEDIYVWLRYACENTTVSFSASSGEPGNWTSFNPNNVLLTPTTLNSTIINISVPRMTPLGDYYGNIQLSAEDQTIDIPLIVHVIPKDIEVNVTVEIQDKTVCLGESVNANVNITKTEPPEPVYMNLTHQLLDPDSVIIGNQSELVYVENSTLREPTFMIPLSSQLGYYTFLSSVQYLDKTDQTYDIFEVISCEEEVPSGGSGGASAPAAAGPPLNYSMSLKLSTNLISSLPGERKTFLAIVNNTGNVNLKNVRLSVKGVPTTWLRIIPNDIEIPYSRVQEFLVVVEIPNNVGPGVYDLKVQAMGRVDTEIKTLKLIVAKTPEELANLLLEEMEARRAIAERAIKTDACLDLSEIIPIFNEGELSREKGLNDYKSKNYEKAVNWFEHAIESYNKVIERTDLKIESKIGALKKQRIGIFPILGLRKEISKLELYYFDKNYGRICEPILEISRLRKLSLVLWALVFTLLIVLFTAFILIRRKRQRYKRKEIISRVRDRLGDLKLEGIEESEEKDENP